MEIEAKLEQERKLREEQSVMLQSMVTWMQGLGASMNYATPPPPFVLPAQPYFPAGPSDTPMKSVGERIEQSSSGPKLAGGPVAILVPQT